MRGMGVGWEGREAFVGRLGFEAECCVSAVACAAGDGSD